MEFPQQIYYTECMWIQNCQITGSDILRYHHVSQPNYIQRLHLRSAMPRVRSPPAAKPPPSAAAEPITLVGSSLDVAHHMGICSMSDQQLLHHIQVQRPCISTNFIQLPSSCLTPEIENLVAKTILGAVSRDLVKVNEPSLKKAPPDALAFGSFGSETSCHAST